MSNLERIEAASTNLNLLAQSGSITNQEYMAIMPQLGKDLNDFVVYLEKYCIKKALDIDNVISNLEFAIEYLKKRNQIVNT